MLYRLIGWLSLGFSVLLFGWRLKNFNRLAKPIDRALPKGDASTGVIYAFSLGMAPWAKESTRRHWMAYLRGVAFHMGIFVGLAVFVASPWIAALPLTIQLALASVTGAGAVLGVMGLIARLIERNLRALSRPDDYFAVIVVSLFLGMSALWLVEPALSPFYYVVSGLLLIYAPLGKIRHCIYFAYSRLFFGRWIGGRAVLPHVQQRKFVSMR